MGESSGRAIEERKRKNRNKSRPEKEGRDRNSGQKPQEEIVIFRIKRAADDKTQ